MVVVIESQESDDEKTAVQDQPKPPSFSPSSSSSTSTSTKKLDSGGGAKGLAERNGDVSDGFETASERDVSDDEDGGDLNKKGLTEEAQKEEVGDRERFRGQKAAPGDSYEDALNDEELKQKALVQANDAKTEGNKLYGNGQYDEALMRYEAALQAAPEIPETVEIRSICHSNRAQCFMKLGKYEETIKECSKALELNPSYVKALVRRAEAGEKLEHYEEAIADLKKILELEPQNNQARRGILRLEPLAAEKREKMKEEMIGKLKDMGNTLLGRFGLSVDNFKAVKDPNTGSYSISFQK